MVDKYTRIELPGQRVFPGLLDHGEVAPEIMIAQARRHAAHLRTQAETIERTADSAFQVDVVRGSIVQHFVKTLQAAS